MAHHAHCPHSESVSWPSGERSRSAELICTVRIRYIYDLYYKREAISKELYNWLLKEEYADAKWVLNLGPPCSAPLPQLTSPPLQLDREVEEAGLRKAVLRQVYPVEGEFR